MFAILDARGRVVGFSGRVLPDPETGVTDKQSPKYINSPESPIYQKGHTLFGLYQARQAIRQAEEAVLVEGNFDVMSLHARGVSNVVAPLGTAFTPSQARLLRRYAPVVTLLFDGDNAGKKATREARTTCKDGGLTAKVAVLPDAKDPDDFVRERGAEALQSAIGAARGLLDYLIEEAMSETVRQIDAHEQAARVREIVTLINEEDDPTVRQMTESYADRIAQRLGIGSLAKLKATVTRSLQAGPGAPTGQREGHPAGDSSRAAPGGHPAKPLPDGVPLPNLAPWRVRSTTDTQNLDLRVLGCFLDFPDLLEEEMGIAAMRELEGDAALAASALISAQVSAQKSGQQISQDVLEILAQLPASLHTFAAERLASPLHQQRDDAREELVKNTGKLKRRGLSREKAELIEALHQFERTGESAAAVASLGEINRRARETHGLKEG